MRRLFELAAVAAVVCGLGCGGITPPPDAGTDAGAEPCVLTFPERFDADTTVARGCYLALKTPVIAANVTVTLAPGVQVRFASETSFAFSANQVLSAVGTEAEPIVFTAIVPVRGGWRGLRFDGTQRASTLDWVFVEFAGDTAIDAQAAAVKLVADSRGVRLAMTNTVIRQSEGWGVWAAGSTDFTAFANNTLTGNALGPASLDSQTVSRLDAASKYAGNDVDRLHVRGSAVTGDATWATLDVPYFIATTVDLDDGVLTLQPGAQLVMNEDTGFKVSSNLGGLDAQGTAERPIVFTGLSQVRGSWFGLSFDGSNNARNRLAHVVVEYAGRTRIDRDNAAVKCTADSRGVTLSLDHVTLRQSQGWGLYLTGSAKLPVFTGNVLTQNTLGPARVHANVTHLLTAASTFTGNDADLVYVDPGSIQAAVRWQHLGVPYVLHGETSPLAVWTIDPGVTLKLANGAWISVEGDAAGLKAAGTASQPITFTGVTQTPGSWLAILFGSTNNPDNVLDHCVIEYGGGGQARGWQGMVQAMSDSHGVQLTLTNSTLRHSGGYGAWLGRYVVATMSGNTFSANASGDVFRQP